jgi:hypothetical protein
MKSTVTDFQNETQQLANMVPNSLDVGDVMKPFPGRPTVMPGSNGAADAGAVATPLAVATEVSALPTPAANGAAEAPKVATKKDPLADFGG